MDEKKYESGKVEISSAEYRDLIKEMVEAKRDASEIRSEKWKLEDEKRKLEQELDSAKKKIAELEGILGSLQMGLHSQYSDLTSTPNRPLRSEITYASNNKEGN